MKHVIAWFLGAAAVAATTGNAHAMGSYSTIEVLAWSDDGASALIGRAHSSSGTAGSSYTFIVVSANDKAMATYDFTNTLDPDTAHEQVTPAACAKAADALGATLASHRIRDIAIHKDHCKTPKRDVVGPGPSAAKLVDASWVAKPAVRTATPRETTAWQLAASEVKDAAADVAATTGKLVLVLWGVGGDDAGPSHGVAFGNGKRLGEI